MIYRPHPCELRHPGSEPRRGVVLLAVIVVVVLLTLAAYQFSQLMTAEARAADSYNRSARAKAVADSGVHYAMGLLQSSDSIQNNLNGNPFYNPSMFQDIVVDDQGKRTGRFSIIAPVDPSDPSGSSQPWRYGVLDENGKINLNALLQLDSSGQIAHDMLMQLPNMTEDVVNSILDWLDPDDDPRANGAEDDYYQGLSPPYHCKNGPLDSLEELLLVKGVTPELLFGADRNRNGVVDEEEASGDAPTDIGWSAYLTVYSRERNVDSAGNPRIYVNDSDLNTLYSNLTSAVGQDLANYILAYRLYGPASNSSSAAPGAIPGAAGPGAGTRGGTNRGGGRGGQGGVGGGGGGGRGTGGGRGGGGNGGRGTGGTGGNGGRGTGGNGGNGGRGTGGGGGRGRAMQARGGGGGMGGAGGRGGSGGNTGRGGGGRNGGGGTGTGTGGGRGGATRGRNPGMTGGVTGATATTTTAGQGQLTRGMLNFNQGRPRSISSLYELINSSVAIPNSTGQGTTNYPSPLNDQGQLQSLLPKLLDEVTTTNSSELPARVNVNTAPAAVLATLPGLADADVQAILAHRPSLTSTDPPDQMFQTPAWLLTEAGLTANKLRALEKYVTTQSQVYRVQVIAAFDGGGPGARVEAVIDSNAGRPRVVYYRDLTELGKGSGLQGVTSSTAPP